MPESDIPAGQTAAPAMPAALTAEQIAEIVTKSIDARIPGLQSGYDKRINDLETKLRESSMDEDELETERSGKLERELASARIEADIQKAARLYPDAYPVFEAIRDAGNAEGQLRVIAERLGQAAPAAPPVAVAPEDDDDTPSVDPNNPRTSGAVSPDGMDAAKANRILDLVGDVWPGR